MADLIVPAEARQQAEQALQRCGSKGRECVVYLAASRDGGTPSRIVRVYHPAHTGSSTHYDVDGEELYRINRTLHERGERILAQMHTHPGSAFHSGRDDEMALLDVPGYLSIVVPSFGADGLGSREGWHVAEYQGHASWRPWSRDEIRDRIVLEGIDDGA